MASMMSGVSDYERLRLANIENNKKMLESLGLLNSFKPILNPIVTKKKQSSANKENAKSVKRKFIKVSAEDEDIYGSEPKKRRSLRKKGIEPDGSIIKYLDDDEDDSPQYKVKKKYVKKENHFGAIEGVEVGTHWLTRMECSSDGVHRPTVAGIHGNESVGCYSIALSGGYEDDIDLGESFTYTGSGGRDLKGTPNKPKNLRTAPQSKDQTLTKVNLALSLNVENRQPVRVIRGYKLQSPFAPEYGYRYDGLYTVEKCWLSKGLSGFNVYKFILKRVEDQPLPPWTTDEENILDNDVPREKLVVDSNNNKTEMSCDVSEVSRDDEDTVGNEESSSGEDVNDRKKESSNVDSETLSKIDSNKSVSDQGDSDTHTKTDSDSTQDIGNSDDVGLTENSEDIQQDKIDHACTDINIHSKTDHGINQINDKKDDMQQSKSDHCNNENINSEDIKKGTNDGIEQVKAGNEE